MYELIGPVLVGVTLTNFKLLDPHPGHLCLVCTIGIQSLLRMLHVLIFILGSTSVSPRNSILIYSYPPGKVYLFLFQTYFYLRGLIIKYEMSILNFGWFEDINELRERIRAGPPSN